MFQKSMAAFSLAALAAFSAQAADVTGMTVNGVARVEQTDMGTWTQGEATFRGSLFGVLQMLRFTLGDQVSNSVATCLDKSQDPTRGAAFTQALQMAKESGWGADDFELSIAKVAVLQAGICLQAIGYKAS